MDLKQKENNYFNFVVPYLNFHTSVSKKASKPKILLFDYHLANSV